MRKVDRSKVVFNCVGLLGLFAAGMVYGGFSPTAHRALDFVRQSIATVYGESFTLIGTRPDHFLQTARYEGNGVTVNAVPGGENELLLLSGFFDNGNELRLIHRDGSIVARWPVRYSELFPDASHVFRPPATDWNIDLHGALIEPDGSVVFNFDYGGLVKLDRCGEVVWTLPRMTHHSVGHAAAGGYWVPGRRLQRGENGTPYPPFQAPFLEDTLLHVSDDGEVLSEIPLVQVLYDNGLETLLTATGHSFLRGTYWDQELIHLNKIGELPAEIADDFPMFDPGDLVISIRQSNLLLVMDPDTGKVKWWKIGPWRRQHDPEFKAGGKIVLFNNNVYKFAYADARELAPVTYPRGSTVVEIDPVTGDTQTLYGDREDQRMMTVIRGKIDLTPRGGLLVTEFEGGRFLETDADGNLIWEYVNRYSEDEVAEVTEARLYPQSYFDVSNWSCGR